MDEPWATFAVIAAIFATLLALSFLATFGFGWVIDRLDPSSHKEGSSS